MTKYCPSCGEELIDNAHFCKSCGTKIDGAQANQNPQEEAPQQFQVPVVEKEYKITIILGYILAVFIPLFGIIIGIYLYTRKDSSKAKNNAKYILILGVGIWLISLFLIR